MSKKLENKHGGSVNVQPLVSVRHGDIVIIKTRKRGEMIGQVYVHKKLRDRNLRSFLVLFAPSYEFYKNKELAHEFCNKNGIPVGSHYESKDIIKVLHRAH